jgi:hypothetical protein
VTLVSAVVPPAREPRRLRAKPLADGSGIEIGPRDDGNAAQQQQQQQQQQQSEPPPFAWPLPLTGPKAWLPYESLLRGVIGAHPFNNLRGALTRGAALRLTRSTLHGVKCVGLGGLARGGG